MTRLFFTCLIYILVKNDDMIIVIIWSITNRKIRGSKG
jgi:hypothetical protein